MAASPEFVAVSSRSIFASTSGNTTGTHGGWHSGQRPEHAPPQPHRNAAALRRSSAPLHPSSRSSRSSQYQRHSVAFLFRNHHASNCSWCREFAEGHQFQCLLCVGGTVRECQLRNSTSGFAAARPVAGTTMTASSAGRIRAPEPPSRGHPAGARFVADPSGRAALRVLRPPAIEVPGPCRSGMLAGRAHPLSSATSP